MPSWIVADAFSFMFPMALALMFVFVFVMVLLVVISALRFVHGTLPPVGPEKYCLISGTGSLSVASEVRLSLAMMQLKDRFCKYAPRRIS